MEYLAVVTEGILYEIPIWTIISILVTLPIQIFEGALTIPIEFLGLTCGIIPMNPIAIGIGCMKSGEIIIDCAIVPAFTLAGATISGVIGGTLGYITNMFMNLICS